MRIALITAVYGGYDPIRPLPLVHGFDDAICITDASSHIGNGWRVMVDPRNEHPRLAAKRPKMMPWLFTDCDAAVWLDASFQVVSEELRPWVEAHLTGNDFVVWQHPEGRFDIRDEVDVSLCLPKYEGSRLREQLQSYVDEGMPQHWGLFACGMIGWVFTDTTMAFGERWYEENVRWSVQDQVSLPFLLWDSGMSFGLWQANEYDNPYVRLRWDERPRPRD
jgi:hypothetical protein